MREVAPGDTVLSFCDTRIAAIGMAKSYCRESPKPVEFGKTGLYWENIGWKIDVAFTVLSNRIRPKDHMSVLGPLLPAKYSPLMADGNGKQSVYLTETPATFAEVLVGLIGREAQDLVTAWRALPVRPAGDDLDMWERRLADDIVQNQDIPETDRLAIVRARVGQGLFKERVRAIKTRCRITGVENPAHLVASHSKPWRDSTNEERLDGENGLLLTPSIDHLFDRGFIGFEDTGRLIVSPVADTTSLERMGIDTRSPVNVGTFTSGQKRFLDFHRNSVLLMSVR